jgi:hypothetical protein
MDRFDRASHVRQYALLEHQDSDMQKLYKYGESRLSIS